VSNFLKRGKGRLLPAFFCKPQKEKANMLKHPLVVVFLIWYIPLALFKITAILKGEDDSEF